MPVDLARFCTRLSQTSWDEVRVRMQQEVSKCVDFAVYRAGLQPRVGSLRAALAVPGKFFFSSDDIAERTRLIRQSLPLEVEALIREADEICRHRFRLLGYADLNYDRGNDHQVDWHLDAVNGKRAPLVPWYRINFLDFNVSGDHKVIWELNRHQHLVLLAKAWRFTRCDRYAKEAIAQWYSWQQANPYPLGVNWASSLEVAFRTLSWLWVERLLADSPTLAPTFADDLLRALALNGRHIERYLSTYFSPNTHLLGEAVALFFLGTLCPQISHARKWNELGWRIVHEQSRKQIRTDGVYFEQSLYYHVYALDFLLHTRLLAALNGVEIPSTLDDVIRRMLAVVEALAQAAPPDGFGDDDGGRLFNPRRNRASDMTDPLAVGAALFRDHSPSLNAPLTEEAIWLFGADALPTGAQPGPQMSQPASRCFVNGGLYILASQAPIAQSMVVDAGPQGTGRSGHGHADALSIKLSLAGRNVLVDSGTFLYIAPGTERQTFRGTRAHNTITVDGLDQADQEGPFAWKALPTTQAEWWIRGNTFTLFAASHSGYERLAQPVRHRRFVFHLHGGSWLLRDVVEGTGTHLLESSWHFAPDVEAIEGENAICACIPTGSPSTSERAAHLTILPVPDSRWKCDLLTNQISPVYGVAVPAQVLRCSALVPAPAEHAILLVPSTHSTGAKPKFSRLRERPPTEPALEAVYSFDFSESSHTTVFGKGTPEPWSFGPWTSDSKFLYFCVNNQKVVRLICCHGSFARLHGESVFSWGAPLQYLEWIDQEGKRSSFSSEQGAVASISEDALDAGILV